MMNGVSECVITATKCEWCSTLTRPTFTEPASNAWSLTAMRYSRMHRNFCTEYWPRGSPVTIDQLIIETLLLQGLAIGIGEVTRVSHPRLGTVRVSD